MNTRAARAALAALQGKLTELTRRGRQERPIAERHPDAIDDALAIAEMNRTAEDRERDSRLIHQIKTALDAIASGTYGTCEDCDETIKPKRLEAVPWALKCVRCAEKAERREQVRRVA